MISRNNSIFKDTSNDKLEVNKCRKVMIIQSLSCEFVQCCL